MTTSVREGRGELSEVLLQIDRVCEREHFVQFYKDYSTMADCVARFFAAGFAQGNVAILIATPERREAIEVRLNAMSVEVLALQKDGGSPVFDAREMLSNFMVNDHPDPRRFRALLGSLMEKALDRGTGVRAFGEVVALLLADGNEAAAIELEHLWNDLGESHEFALFCAYAADQFLGGKSNCLGHVCRAHSRVISG